MGLLSWQEPFAERLKTIFDVRQSALSTLPTGSGKTYIACDVANRLGRSLFVACPKAVLSSWRDVAGKMGSYVTDVLNPESTRMKTVYFHEGKWTLPPKILFVHDEPHRGASGAKSAQTKMFGLLKAYPDVKVLMQSATIADNPMKMRYVGWMLDQHGFNQASFWDWCRRHGCYKSQYHDGMDFPKGERGRILMQQINLAIADRMISCKIDDIPGFPDCDIQTVLVDVDENTLAEVQCEYAKVQEKVSVYSANILPQQLAARQLSEIAKVGVLSDMVTDLLEEGAAPILFLNFHLSIDAVRDRLLASGKSVLSGVIDGRVPQLKRDQTIDDFQNDRLPVLICQVATGGVGINLHADKPWLRPRVSLICPDYSASNMVQCIGRTWRVGSYHKVIQKFVLLAGSIEERIAEAIENKRGNISALQDGDLV